MSDIKTLLTDEQIKIVARGHMFEAEMTEETMSAFARSIERATIAALAQAQGIPTVTTNERGEPVAFTMQDEEHRVLRTIWQREQAQGAEPVARVGYKMWNHNLTYAIIANRGLDPNQSLYLAPSDYEAMKAERDHYLRQAEILEVELAGAKAEIEVAVAERDRLAAEVERLKAAQPTDFDAEFLSKRLARVAKLASVSMPDLTHRDIAGVAGTILGTIASKLERASQPQEAGQARELTDDEIVKALHSAGIDTYPSKYGFDALQVSATSVPNLRKVIEVFAQSSPAVPKGLSDELILRCAGGKLEFLSQSGLLHFARTIIAEYKARIPAAAPSAPQQKEGDK